MLPKFMSPDFEEIVSLVFWRKKWHVVFQREDSFLRRSLITAWQFGKEQRTCIQTN